MIIQTINDYYKFGLIMENFFNFIIADYNLPFSASIISALVLFIFERISNLLLIGKLGCFLQLFTKKCDWFNLIKNISILIYIGIAPMVMFMMVYSAIFGLTGFTIQYITLNCFNLPLNVWIAIITAFIISWIPMYCWLKHIDNQN